MGGLTNSAQSNVKSQYSGRADYVDVPCGSLTKVLLDIFPFGVVSFFSLDVEGAEMKVLKNIDFSKVFIEIFMIESYNTFCGEKCETRDQVRILMAENGYNRFSGIIPNPIYMFTISQIYPPSR